MAEFRTVRDYIEHLTDAELQRLVDLHAAAHGGDVSGTVLWALALDYISRYSISDSSVSATAAMIVFYARQILEYREAIQDAQNTANALTDQRPDRSDLITPDIIEAARTYVATLHGSVISDILTDVRSFGRVNMIVAEAVTALSKAFVNEGHLSRPLSFPVLNQLIIYEIALRRALEFSNVMPAIAPAKDNTVPKLKTLTPQEILDLPLREDNDSGAGTIRGYFDALLRALLAQGEGFSGKRPFGNSGWERDLYYSLVKAGVVKGEIDEEYDALDDCDEKAADKLLHKAITAFTSAPT